MQVAALIGPVYPFFITSALFQALKRPIYSLYMTILRLTLIPFMSLWYVINIRNGEYQDIFYTILVTNWMMGLVVLTFVPFFLKRVFRISFKKIICILVYSLIFLQNKILLKLALSIPELKKYIFLKVYR